MLGSERGSRGSGYMYTYSLSTLMYGRNQHNIVSILQLKINKLKRKRLVAVGWPFNAYE